MYTIQLTELHNEIFSKYTYITLYIGTYVLILFPWFVKESYIHKKPGPLETKTNVEKGEIFFLYLKGIKFVVLWFVEALSFQKINNKYLPIYDKHYSHYNMQNVIPWWHSPDPRIEIIIYVFKTFVFPKDISI